MLQMIEVFHGNQQLTFLKISQKLREERLQESKILLVNTYRISNIIQNPTSPDIFIFLGKGKISFTSTNCGTSIKMLYHDRGIAKI